MLRVPGLGPKRAAALYHELGVATLGRPARGVRVAPRPRAEGLWRKDRGRHSRRPGHRRPGRRSESYWADADQIAQALRGHLSACGAIREMEIAGSYRRGKDTVGDLDILVVAKRRGRSHGSASPPSPAWPSMLARGDTKMSVRLQSKLQVDLRVVPAESFGAALQYFTGSKAHNIVLRGMAKSRGLKINEYGVFRGEKQIAGRTEEEVYAAVDLPWIPPELREARSEFDWAAAGRLPTLIEPDDIRGDLHAHSTWTDGTATIEEMVEAAQSAG